MRNHLRKAALLSSVASSALPRGVRGVSLKRLGRVRLSWFLMGSAFGAGISFFLHLLIAAMLSPATPAPMVAQLPAAADGASAEANATPPRDAGTEGLPAIAAVASAPLPPAPVAANAAPPTPSYPLKLAITLGKGKTLMDLLTSNRVQEKEAHRVVAALKAKMDPARLSVGQKISITLARHETVGDAAAVQELAIRLPNLSTVALQRLQNGSFNVAATEDTTTQKSFRGFGKVRSSILQAGADAHIPAAAMHDIVKAFSYDVDFQREIHPGDTIEVLMDRKPASKGKGYSGYAGVRYAALTLEGEKHEIFRYKGANGEMAWFDGNGNSIRKSLLRTPVDAVHITSGFGMRTHPIMGYTKFHRGVDFGAASGTPIMAAGDGTVTFKGWKNGYGNFVVIKHNATYETAYGHCSRFGNITVGSKVKQGQVIAYVGMTGMATGPHLHYEVHENDVQVNPVAKQFNMASGLTGKSLAAFKTAKQSALNELASLAKGSAAVASAR